MAEQEACAELVEKATTATAATSSSSTTTTFEGESQLLPLLQGLLSAPETTATTSSEQTPDSGTESGEDQRNGLIAEVQLALSKLSTNLLANDDANNDVTPERRSSLLHLVTRLQAGLAASLPRSRARKERPNHHQQLLDARRLIDEISLTPSSSSTKIVVKNATAKPFNSSTESSSVQTPTESLEQEDKFEEKPETDEDSTVKASKPNLDEKTNRFNTKKMKMKRANTIDIPKPLKFYEDEADSDFSGPETDDYHHQKRRNTYLALRGPIRVGTTNSTTSKVPPLEPKTENDKKFLAFINKHNEASTKSSLWSKPSSTSKTDVWTNKFGNIKTSFESNSARQFWKSADDARTTYPKYDGPRISRQSARNLQQMFDEKHGTIAKEANIVTGTLKVNQLAPKKALKEPVNMFSHAPQSAFKPLPKKAVPPTLNISKHPVKSTNELGSPLYLYSPKPSNEPSPKPWAVNSGEHRVLSLAAAKFENLAQNQPIVVPQKPRKMIQDKVFVPLKQTEKITAPYLAKNSEEKSGNTVRKLSGQYDNLGGTTRPNEGYATFSTVKYSVPQPAYNQQQYYNNQYHQYPQQNQYYPPQNQYGAPYQPNYMMQGVYPNNQYYRQEVPNYNYSNYQVQSQYVAPPQQQFIPQQQYHQVPPQEYPRYQEFQTVNHCETEPKVAPKLPIEKQYLPDTFQTNNHYDAKPQPVVPPKLSDKHLNDQYHPVPTLSFQTVNHYEAKPEPLVPPKQSNKHVKDQYQHSVPSPPFQTVDHYEPKPQVEKITIPPKVETQLSVDNLKEYHAINSRVMTGPVQQLAETVRQKSPMNRNEHDMAAALGLQKSLHKLTNSTTPVPSPTGIETSMSPTNLISAKSFTYKSPSPGKVVPEYKNENRTEVNDHGDTIITSKFHIPVINVAKAAKVAVPPPSADQVVNKAEAWKKVCLHDQKPSPRASPNARTIAKSKSSHALMPGMTRDEIAAKRRTMEAFFGGGTTTSFKAPNALTRTSSSERVNVKKTTINRVKSSEKSGTGLSRSRTLPDIACPDLLDENNVDAAFEDLFKSVS